MSRTKLLSGVAPPACSTAGSFPAMVRKVMRKPRVLEATGWSNSTLYAKIAQGIFPPPTQLDPTSRTVVWFEDQVAEFQKRAVERQAQGAV